MYNHCNISIYFCNIRMKHLQYTSKIFETLATDAYNMRFQRKHLIAAWRMEARQHVEFSRGSSSAMHAGSTRRWLRDKEGGQQPRAGAGRQRPRAALGRVSSRAPRLTGGCVPGRAGHRAAVTRRQPRAETMRGQPSAHLVGLAVEIGRASCRERV